MCYFFIDGHGWRSATPGNGNNASVFKVKLYFNSVG